MSEKLVPELRFPEFEGEWESNLLSHFLTVSREKNRDEVFDRDKVLSVSGDYGIVNQIEHLGRSYAGASLKEYKVVRSGSVVYTKSPLSSNPYGIIRTNFGPAGVVSTLYAVYKVTDEALPAFIDFYFGHNDYMNRYIRPLVNKGAKNDMKISNDRVLIDPVTFPAIPEQKKIADFLSAVDAKLTALEQQVEGWTRFKRGLMQALFSQRLRFKDDDGVEFPAWTAKELGDVVGRNPHRTPKNLPADFPCVEMDSLETDRGLTGKIYEYGWQKSNKRYFAKGNVLFGKLRPYLRKFAHASFDGVCSTEIWVLDGKGIVNEYLFYLVQLPSFIAASNKTSGSKMPRADWSLMSTWPIKLPSLSEQRKIADALSAVDGKIDALSDRLEAVRTFKRGLLQKMFV